ncbi:GAP family protein [Mycolicibacterium sp.]|uniref:GAP family protein n=1 Tax=Mycolicibacterium sp. TaxID=2320850 RepID=UPI001A2C5380|nr:GAP family protein [Mycolicibacterium sp.]MBJ7336630.1 GAP family protein [Mycolicibacterium sp.]
MSVLLGELTAFATVVALSPFSVIPAIALVIHSARPKPTGAAFIAGWLTGKAALTVLFIQAPRVPDGLDRPAPHWTTWVRLVAGVLCIAAGIWYWFKPPRAVEPPRWVTRIKEITPAGAAAVGIALTVVNVKVLLACAAAGFAIGAAQLSSLGVVGSVTYFTLLAGSTAAVPILAYLRWSHRVDSQLERFATWMQRRQTAITTTLLILIGIGLLYNGIAAVISAR